MKKKVFFPFLVAVIVFKVAFYFFATDFFSFGGGSDAAYYDAYATGHAVIAVNAWPTVLLYLNEIGLYSRPGIAAVLFTLSMTLLPYFYAKCVVSRKESVFSSAGSRGAFLLILMYPTIYFFTFDVYRDLVMFLATVLSFYCLKQTYSATSVRRGFFFFCWLFFCWISYLFREYLGVALLLAPMVAWWYVKTKPRLRSVFILYLIFLVAIQTSGYLDPLFDYRGEDGFSDGGSTLGIGLKDRSAGSFLLFYGISFFAQVGGFFVPNLSAIFVFFIESVPFMLAFWYVLRNLKYGDDFCNFLLAFFVIYTSIWVIGNDNLGTAVRLRVPSYLAIFSCFFIIRLRKVHADKIDRSSRELRNFRFTKRPATVSQ
jgi:hypothetical protein